MISSKTNNFIKLRRYFGNSSVLLGPFHLQSIVWFLGGSNYPLPSTPLKRQAADLNSDF